MPGELPICRPSSGLAMTNVYGSGSLCIFDINSIAAPSLCQIGGLLLPLPIYLGRYERCLAIRVPPPPHRVEGRDMPLTQVARTVQQRPELQMRWTR
jgi:hypothetical protein